MTKEEKAIQKLSCGGVSLEVNAIKFLIPDGYCTQLFTGGANVFAEGGIYLGYKDPPEHARRGMMQFFFQSDLVKSLGDKRTRDLIIQQISRGGLHHVADMPRSLAGHKGICSEKSVVYGGEVEYGTRLYVVCTFDGEGYLHFEGTPPSAADFYQIIETAEPIKGTIH